MAFVNYSRTVSWDATIINVGLNGDGLGIDGQKITAGAPTNIAKRWIASAFVQNVADGKWYKNNGTIDSPNFQEAGTGGGGNQTYNEVVSGNTTSFTLAATPSLGTERIYGIGQRLTPTVDYSISGANITTMSSWNTGDLLADYET